MEIFAGFILLVVLAGVVGAWFAIRAQRRRFPQRMKRDD